MASVWWFVCLFCVSLFLLFWGKGVYVFEQKYVSVGGSIAAGLALGREGMGIPYRLGRGPLGTAALF